MPTIDFPATPTQEKFINSEAYLNFCMAARGEGKTTSALVATMRHAMRYGPAVWPIKWAVIRDTWENIKITTMDTIRVFCRKYKIPAQGLELKEPKVVQRGMQTESGVFKPLVEFHFFGLDQPSDANRLQGFEGAGAWIEEPAPAADLASGIPEDALLAVTSLRQGAIEGVQPRVQVTLNPPDETHWTIKYRDDEDTIDAMQAQGISIGFFEIPTGENPGITKEYRERNRAMLEAMGRPDLVARLVEGKVGFLQLGVSVTPEYSSLHESKISLPILRRVPIIRSWDFGLNPTTVWYQHTPHGRLYIFKSIRGEHMGCENHIQHNVIPWQIAHGIHEYMFEDFGDPNGLSPEAKNSNVSAVTAIEEMLTASPGVPASFTPGPIPIMDRVGPIRFLLRQMNKFGQPVIQVDPEATEMRRALGGGWHRRKTPAGIIGEIVKDEHCCDLLTECLTPSGWKTYDQVQAGDAVYGFSMPTQDLEVTRVTAVNVYPGLHAAVRFYGQPLDMVVTPNHRVMAARRIAKNRGWHPAVPVLATDLHSNHYFLRVSTLSAGGRTSYYTDEFVRICAWVSAEGSYRTNGGVRLFQSRSHNPQYVEELDRLLFRYPGVTRQGEDRVVAVWNLTRELAKLIREAMPSKIPSPEFIAAMRPPQRRLFLYEFIRGDGTWEHAEYGPLPPPPERLSVITRFWVRPGTPIISQKRKDAIDCLQHIATLSGIRSSIHQWGQSGIWYLSLTRQGRYTAADKMSSVAIEIDGAWCPTTSLGTWVARRNGHVFITGNSEHGDSLGYGLGVKFPIPKLIERPRKPQPRRSNPVGISGDRSWMTT